MNSQEILTKAIQKAIDGGWGGSFLNARARVQEAGSKLYFDNVLGESWSLEEIIFNHGFAKALWGAELTDAYVALHDMGGSIPMWQSHLMGMVIAEDPIKYLGEHLDGN